MKKRFRMEYVDLSNHIVDEDGRYIDDFELLDLLNNLYEETIMLKGEVAYYKLMLLSLENVAKNFTERHMKGGIRK